MQEVIFSVLFLYLEFHVCLFLAIYIFFREFMLHIYPLNVPSQETSVDDTSVHSIPHLLDLMGVKFRGFGMYYVCAVVPPGGM